MRISRRFVVTRFTLALGITLLAGTGAARAQAPALSPSPSPPDTDPAPPPEASADLGNPRLAESDNPYSCPYCVLEGRDFTGLDLTNINLTGAILRGADFEGTNLDGAMLIGADLRDANLDRATLDPSDRGPANLSRADLTGASMEGTEMEGADLQFALMDAAARARAARARAIVGPEADRLSMAGADDEIACGRADLSGLARRVYVAPGGTDAQGCGASFEAACQTIGYGIGQCSGGGCGVLVAWAQYRLAQTLELAAGVNVYGGCLPVAVADPSYVSVIVAPTGGVPAVRAQRIDTATLLQGFEVTGTKADGKTGAPSIAVWVEDSEGLSVRDSQLVASVGAPGEAGASGAPGVAGGAGGIDGTRNPGTNSSCGSTTTGGQGSVRMDVSADVSFTKVRCTPSCSANGCGGYWGSPGETGVSTAPGNAGSGNCGGSCFEDPGSPGKPGGDGRAGACGSGAAASQEIAGTFSAGTWTPSRGGNGGSGQDAAGGAGGGAGGYKVSVCFWVASTSQGNWGGGGGAGGCHGTGGAGGQQGGASFALVAFRSHVDLTGSSVVSGQGGPGGLAGGGRSGGAGGAGTGGGTSQGGGQGGAGGSGGAGGAGAGGAGGNGGPTIGVGLVDGATVAGSDTVFYPGRSGALGGRGAGGAAIVSGACTAPDGETGREGVITNVYVF